MYSNLLKSSQKEKGKGGEGNILDFRLGDLENYQLPITNYQLSTVN
ncbi:MAG: hypothetical protein HC786_24115 [Richelia sp. CSU_2_1]|nr:hypothetical protein [Microcoleus sp. SU_5_6]NJL66337.1 hypothetical protein [Microcoleus sp. SM1_3_4]NJR25026.1 hypothetical protein [Richelia sp. CSU_2_1]